MILFSPPRIDDKLIHEVTDALKSVWITTGPKTKLFKKNQSYCNFSGVLALIDELHGRNYYCIGLV